MQPHPPQATWSVPALATSAQTLDLRAVSLLLDAPRDAAPARAMLHFLNALLPVEFISLVSHGEELPAQLEGHAFHAGTRNVTRDCFTQYRRHFYLFDDATRITRHMRSQTRECDTVTALHLRSRDVPDAAWRHRIYEREHLTERLALLYMPAPRTAFSINRYRSESMGSFAPQEIERVLAVSPLLRQVHRNLVGGATAHADMPTRIALARARLAAGEVHLSARELDVAARIACGMTADGIAADLDIAPSSVLTLRKRAYARLGIHDRAALARRAA
ncbi:MULTISPECIES: helix-turn-helix transcriptional regulator [unclassified Variovorax]|uniref:helix-turn-helix transcriptional regulator n=1 Tax=unclassified Variovorax TaxID=663243 RepID=UPI0008C253E6|nr:MULTISPECIES: helix-turn-helix transcriptional regulator [unclassified Variovorax]SEK16960.1 regulatory protein, luxR family [Variovorax sp. OK202]SFE65956.1 regulatory protein, luxR family [Variovorax sp. OK212]